jgi:peptidoglycan/xylan/chitin deacetylase (PgdA/CDA1 family)
MGKRMMYQLFNRFQPLFSSHILLYHATYKSIPEAIRNGLHNVDPDTLFRQIQWFKKYFDIVNVDDLFDSHANALGKVAITFDDAYDSVFTEAIPVLEALDAPCTIYLNGVSYDGKPFWRDKIRYLMNNNLVESFLTYNQEYSEKKCLTESNFYRKTKSKFINSKNVDTLLDAYLNIKNIANDKVGFCINDKGRIKKHRLISYGNHTYNHYVLSSLAKEQQELEIKKNQELLQGLDVKYSKVFSIPFGSEDDFDQTTIGLLNKYQYKAFLFSEGRINLKALNQENITRPFSLLSGERYMVESNEDLFQRQLFKLGIKGLINRYM